MPVTRKPRSPPTRKRSKLLEAVGSVGSNYLGRWAAVYRRTSPNPSSRTNKNAKTQVSVKQHRLLPKQEKKLHSK